MPVTEKGTKNHLFGLPKELSKPSAVICMELMYTSRSGQRVNIVNIKLMDLWRKKDLAGTVGWLGVCHHEDLIRFFFLGGGLDQMFFFFFVCLVWTYPKLFEGVKAHQRARNF